MGRLDCGTRIVGKFNKVGLWEKRAIGQKACLAGLSRTHRAVQGRARNGPKSKTARDALLLYSPHFFNLLARKQKSLQPKLQAEHLVASIGFEPTISALRGRRPKPLDDEAMSAYWLGWKESNPHIRYQKPLSYH